MAEMAQSSPARSGIAVCQAAPSQCSIKTWKLTCFGVDMPTTAHKSFGESATTAFNSFLVDPYAGPPWHPSNTSGKSSRSRAGCVRWLRVCDETYIKVIGATHTVTPPVITVDKNAAYPKTLFEIAWRTL